jgi:hypothetical protein
MNNALFSRRQFLSRLPAASAVAAVALPRASAAAEVPPRPGRFAVTEFGAKGDGQTLDTDPLQQAIDACGQNGGGTVRFPPGRYLTGTLRLRSRVTLEFDPGATLLGSRRLEDYPSIVPSIRSYTDNYTERSLLYGEQLEHVTLRGRGIIDGQGAAFKGAYKVRPYLIRMVSCRDVSVHELTLKDSPMWVQHYLACEEVLIDGITVRSKCNANNDGIDIDGCQRVRIANCDIQSGDDAMVLKATLNRPCQQVVISNCLLSSDCNAFKLGTESNGGFSDIALSNCVLYDTRLAGIALEMVDGGTLERVTVSNVTMTNVRGPIFIRLGDRARPFQAGQPRPGVGRLRSVQLSDIQATGADPAGCSISGLVEHPVESVTLSNIRLHFAGGGAEDQARRPVPEKPESYPEYSMFGTLPAYGFYCRHARNVAFNNLEVSCAKPDARPSLICDDVDQLRLFAWQALTVPSGAPAIRLLNVRDALVQACRATAGTATYFQVAGKETTHIRFVANELSHARRSVETDPDVPPGAVDFGGSAPR